jgi:indole-3-glycerol phosphate synthase
MTILASILTDKRAEIARRKAGTPEAALRAAAAERPRPPGFAAALRSRPVGLIAEVKRRSPSAGAIREPFDPPAIARAYEAAGAQAVSVLMDAKYFGGGEADFRAVRAAVGLPMLYKEFVVDPWQIAHASALGASAVLLIAGALGDAELRSFSGAVRAAGLEPLVEVHDEAELERALACGAGLVGINNRDLRTFVTSVETTVRLAGRVPAGVTLVSESGIRGPDDVARLRAAGVHAILVGEHLLRQADVGAAVRGLMAGVSPAGG